MISTIGSVITGAGVLLFLYAVARAHSGTRAGNDPWRGDTLEWYTTSPPPPHNFDSLPAGDERAAARRPAQQAEGAQCALSRRDDRRAGAVSAAGRSPAQRLRRPWSSSARPLAVRARALGAQRSSPCRCSSAAVIIARIAYPRLLAPPSTALGSWSLAVATGGLVAVANDARWAIAVHVAAAGGVPRCLARRARALLPRRAGRRSGPWRDYITLTKPRIMSLLLLTGAAGMFVGAEGWPDGWLFLATMTGLALACGGSSALNHVMDADIDKLMGERTAARPVASGRVAAPRALEFGVVLMALSFALLATTVNVLTAALALVGGLFYVVVYTGYLKRSTDQNIVIGGAAGAVPPLVGFAAATGNLALPALWLFLIVFLWTPPHFWALALMIKEHYAAANVPMLPGTRGDRETTRQILLYSIVMVAFTVGGRLVARPRLHRRCGPARRLLPPPRVAAPARHLAPPRGRALPLLARVPGVAVRRRGGRSTARLTRAAAPRRVDDGGTASAPTAQTSGRRRIRTAIVTSCGGGIPRSRESRRRAIADIVPMSAIRFASLCCAVVAAATLVSGAALAQGAKSQAPPKNLHGFLLRPSEPLSHVFSRTPAFAWAPVRGALCYEFELASSRSFAESSVVWSNVRNGVKPGTGCAAVAASAPDATAGGAATPATPATGASAATGAAGGGSDGRRHHPGGRLERRSGSCRRRFRFSACRPCRSTSRCRGSRVSRTRSTRTFVRSRARARPPGARRSPSTCAGRTSPRRSRASPASCAGRRSRARRATRSGTRRSARCSGRTRTSPTSGSSTPGTPTRAGGRP